jgi:hypothetical protein
MPTADASLRQDLIENAVQHEVVRIETPVATEQALDAAFDTELEHDLTTWPREYLETYLDSDDQGRVPLNEASLQDLLEAAFDRNEQLANGFRRAIEDRGARTVEGHTKTKESGLESEGRGLSESFRAAEVQAKMLLGPSTETRLPMTRDGVYIGSIISDTPDYLLQRISGVTAIAHPKSLLGGLPEIGKLVRIAYHEEKAIPKEILVRQPSRGIER